MTEEEYINKLIEVCTKRLDELNESKLDKQYVLGEKSVYVELLKLIKKNDKKNLYKLDYDIDEKYPIDYSLLKTKYEN